MAGEGPSRRQRTSEAVCGDKAPTRAKTVQLVEATDEQAMQVVAFLKALTGRIDPE